MRRHPSNRLGYIFTRFGKYGYHWVPSHEKKRQINQIVDGLCAITPNRFNRLYLERKIESIMHFHDRNGLTRLYTYVEGGDNTAIRNFLWKRLPIDVNDPSRRIDASGRSMSFDEATIDHIFPQHFNGSHYLANLQLLHGDVNSTLGTTTDNKPFVFAFE